MNKHKNSVEEAIDLILNEETVGNLQPGEFITKEMPCPKATENNVRYPKMNKNHGMMDVFEGKKGKKYEKQPLPEEDAEEDAESMEYDSYSNSIRSWLDSNYGKTGTVYDISRIFTPDETRTVMKVLQQMANKGEITIDHSTVKLNPVSESSLFDYSSSENDTDDSEDKDDDECCDKKCKKPVKNKKCSEDAEDDDTEGEDVKAAEEIHNGAEYTLKDAVKDYFESSVSGSVGGVRLNSAIKDIKEKTGVSKPRVIEVIKELLKSKELVKGPDGNTLIYNSKAEKNNEDDEIINMQSSTAKNQYQPISNKETPQTLKAKGWKDNGNGLFVSPDNKQQFIFSNESKTININTMNNRNNKFDFDLLVEEFGEELEKMNTEQDLDQTAGLDELSDDEGLGDTDEIEDDGDEVEVTLTKSEARLLSDLASKLSAVLGGAEDDMVDDEATDEAANADLMGDDEVSFDDSDDDDTFEDDTELDDEEDSEELSDNSSAYTGTYNNQGASMSRSNASYGNERRKPIEGGYKPSAHGSAKEVTYGPTGASLSKHNGSYGKERRDPVPSRNTSLANSKRSIFD